MEDFMKLAIDEAREGIRHDHGGPFGVVIVKDGVVLSKAHNTVLRDQDSTCHAEIQAIREASKKIHSFDLSGCILFSTGKPCPMCSSAIKWAKISQVYYACGYEDAKDIGFNELDGNNSNYKETQVSREDCKQLYQEYKSLNRERY
ncbi:nucleoside deaminase [Candidatus Dojkabacteria bacterium]|nr:nucleoside deaminase [Candidatus Dojkabacteria bacterium]